MLTPTWRMWGQSWTEATSERENSVCGHAGDDDLGKWCTGRYHMERDEENVLFGHAPQEERLVV